MALPCPATQRYASHLLPQSSTQPLSGEPAPNRGSASIIPHYLPPHPGAVPAIPPQQHATSSPELLGVRAAACGRGCVVLSGDHPLALRVPARFGPAGPLSGRLS